MVRSDEIKDDGVIASKGKSKVTDEEEIPEEMMINDPFIVEDDVENMNPGRDKNANVEDVATLSTMDKQSNVKLPFKIFPPFRQRLTNKEEDVKFNFF